MNSSIKTPWEKAMGVVPMHLEYPLGSMFDTVNEMKEKYPKNIAYDFMGGKGTYTKLINEIKEVAASLQAIGVKEGDAVTIALPNCPQAIAAFYAVNYIGAISNMIHPLSAPKEIEFYIKDAASTVVITLDQFYSKFLKVVKETDVKNFIITSIKDKLNLFMKIGYDLTIGRKTEKMPKHPECLLWKKFLSLGKGKEAIESKKGNYEHSVTLYSGGTTGTTKGIALTNYNFNVLSRQIVATNPMFTPGDKMLAAMPTFHGFGLGVCIHSMLANGGRCVLVPRFTAQSYSKLITKYQCNFIAGVPTLYEALLRLDTMKDCDLSFLKGVFSGGDSLSIELKKKFDAFLESHKATIQIREGYGTTECVTASCLTPLTNAKEGSIGVPFPDTYYRIVNPGTDDEVEYGVEGEIVLTGPSVMKEYVNHPKETLDTLHIVNGVTWLHTGDLGYMDEEGYIFFKGRIKRMIVSSGYNIYPAQIENIIEQHEAVQVSCVIGIPDSYKMHKPKAFVVLKNGIHASEELKKEILEHCKHHVAKYAVPCDVEFRDNLPKTLVGKVAYRLLEEEELAKNN